MQHLIKTKIKHWEGHALQTNHGDCLGVCAVSQRPTPDQPCSMLMQIENPFFMDMPIAKLEALVMLAESLASMILQNSLMLSQSNLEIDPGVLGHSLSHHMCC